MLHIKLKGMEHRAPCKHKFCPYTLPLAPGGLKAIFSESSHAAYQIKRNGAKSTMQAHILFLQTHLTCGSG